MRIPKAMSVGTIAQSGIQRAKFHENRDFSSSPEDKNAC